MCIFFFFFQAEDGIRDFHVTGVQTCALPILCSSAGAYCGALLLSASCTASVACASSAVGGRPALHPLSPMVPQARRTALHWTTGSLRIITCLPLSHTCGSLPCMGPLLRVPHRSSRAEEALRFLAGLCQVV